MNHPEKIRVLITVKAYPEISQSYGEVVCVAGVRVDRGEPEWVRLWPFQEFRDEQYFKKYELLELETVPGTDSRPESLKPIPSSIEKLAEITTKNGWRERRHYVEPLITDSMCGLLERQAEDRTSLGLIRPTEVIDLVVDEARPWTDAQRNALSQLDLFSDEDAPQLEWMPYRFKYHYRCAAEGCNTHTQGIVDWEIYQFYRRVRQDPDWEDRMRQRFIGDLCADDRDTAFYVGNQFQAPRGFLVLGVWWPPKQEASQPSLLDL